jgi:uncharacterized protein YkwD
MNSLEIVKSSEKLKPFITSSIVHYPPLVRASSLLTPLAADQRQNQLTLWALENGGKRLPDYEAGVVELTNQHRKQLSGVGAVQLMYDTDGALDYIATWKSQDMANCMYLMHDQHPTCGNHPGTTVSDRFYGNGYSVNAAWGENAAYGLQTPEDVVTAWLSDIGHRQNLEGPWTYIGVCAVRAANGLIFWTQDFGTVHCPVGIIPPPQPVPVPVPVPPPPTPPPAPLDETVVRAFQQWQHDKNHNILEIVNVSKGTPKVAHYRRIQPNDGFLGQINVPSLRRNYTRIA